jgi:hypothetical protein
MALAEDITVVLVLLDVVLVVLDVAHPAAVQLSQQLAKLPTLALPPLGAVH